MIGASAGGVEALQVLWRICRQTWRPLFLWLSMSAQESTARACFPQFCQALDPSLPWLPATARRSGINQ